MTLMTAAYLTTELEFLAQLSEEETQRLVQIFGYKIGGYLEYDDVVQPQLSQTHASLVAWCASFGLVPHLMETAVSLYPWLAPFSLTA